MSSSSISIGAFLDTLQQLLARSRLVTTLALKIRNQCNAIIRKSLAPQGHNHALNGELWLVELLGSGLKTVVDVGANTGAWALSVLGKVPAVDRLIVFEPNPAAFESLRRNLSGMPSVVYSQKALGDKRGSLSFWCAPDAGELSSLVKEHAPRGSTEVRVAVSTLDEEVDRLGVQHIDLLKIDAEGYDFRVILGSRRLLDEHRISIIQFEYNEPWRATGSTLTHAAAFLEGMGYALFLIKGPGKLERANPEKYGEYFGYSNYIAVADVPAAIESYIEGRR